MSCPSRPAPKASQRARLRASVLSGDSAREVLLLLWSSSFGKWHQLKRGRPRPEPSPETPSPACPESRRTPVTPKRGCQELLLPRLINVAVLKPSTERRTGDALPSSDHPKGPSAAPSQHKYSLSTVYFLLQQNISQAALRKGTVLLLNYRYNRYPSAVDRQPGSARPGRPRDRGAHERSADTEPRKATGEETSLPLLSREEQEGEPRATSLNLGGKQDWEPAVLPPTHGRPSSPPSLAPLTDRGAEGDL